jgi:hypothetical protein
VTFQLKTTPSSSFIIKAYLVDASEVFEQVLECLALSGERVFRFGVGLLVLAHPSSS